MAFTLKRLITNIFKHKTHVEDCQDMMMKMCLIHEDSELLPIESIAYPIRIRHPGGVPKHWLEEKLETIGCGDYSVGRQNL